MRGSVTATLLCLALPATACGTHTELTGDPDGTDTHGPDLPPEDGADTAPDSGELDSDGDCLTDHDEVTIHGTDPLDPDTDHDGLSDFVEVVLGCDPLSTFGCDVEGDFIVVLPYMAPAHAYLELTFGTNLQKADLYFLFDTTGSMSPSIEDVAENLEWTIIPGLRAEIPDVQMGVGHFNDVPAGIYGGRRDSPYWHEQDITYEDDAVLAALHFLHGPEFPWGGGGDAPESHVIALWCAATGLGFTDCSSAVPEPFCPPHPDELSPRVGYPCFRPDALPVIVNVSDAAWHGDHTGADPYDCTSTGFSDARDALDAIGARHVGIFVQNLGMDGLAAMQQMSRSTGTVDMTGEPLVEQVEAGEVSTGIVDMFATLATSTPQDVSAVGRDEPDDPPGAEYDASLFIKDATPLYGFPDSPEGFSHMDETFFHGAIPGTHVTFRIDLYNNTLPPPETPLVLRAKIVVTGNGVTVLDGREALIIVPGEGCDGS